MRPTTPKIPGNRRIPQQTTKQEERIMTIRTYKIGDVKLNLVSTETEQRHIAITQGTDVIILSIDQAKEIESIFNKV